ncbi:glycosyltransferase family 87 protein [Novosphingobium sp. BL-8A]
MRAMLDAQRKASGTQGFMPWTYPPPFTLMMQGLAHLPIGIAFATFTLASLAFYTWILRRIAGQWFVLAMIAVAPAIILNLRTGQNGFLVAGLIGAFLLTFRDRRPIAGLPLGLIIIKPHLGVGVGLVTLLKRSWQIAFIAGTVIIALLGLATWSYGIGIWADFRNAVNEASGFLANGYYRLFRMSSIYASAYTFGIGPLGAMALQLIGAITALGILTRACLRNVDNQALCALTCVATLFVSPYGYDYDLTILGLALAFVILGLMERCSSWEIVALFALSWFVCGFGLGWATAISAVSADTTVTISSENAGLALIAPALIALCCWTTHILRRHQHHSTDLNHVAVSLN